MNTAQLEVETPEGRRVVKQETLDPLASLCTAAGPRARVGFTVGTQYDFGRIKVSAVVTYECDQTASKVNEAGLLAFQKAQEFVADGMQCLLETPPAGAPT